MADEVIKKDDAVEVPGEEAPVAEAVVEDVPAEVDATPLTLDQVPAGQSPQDALVQAQLEARKQQFMKFLEDLNTQLDAAVARGEITEEGKRMILKSEQLKMDDDLLSRQGIVQISQGTVFQFFKTVFEFNSLLNGVDVKLLGLYPNHAAKTLDLVIAHRDLEPVPEGQPIPPVRMPTTAFSDFNMLMAARRKDAEMLQQILREGGWEGVTVTQGPRRIIIPR